MTADPRREEHLFVGCTPGLEPALDAEVRALGISLRRAPGGVEVHGRPGLHRELNLHLRCASRVLLRLGTFPAATVQAFQAGLAGIPLRDYWTSSQPLRVGVTAHRSRLHHTTELRQLAARAFGATLATLQPADGEDGGVDELLVQLRIDKDVCTVSVDTSGALLYRRGYRQEVSRAPLRETLAAGLLVLAGYRGDEPLWDPMCGSGTIPIEAAWLSMRRPPGLDRTFAFQSYPTHDERGWSGTIASARATVLPAPRAPIYATDVHAGALGTARRNARRAGVVEHLKLERSDLLKRTFVPSERQGLLVANLPYGIRVGEKAELKPLYDGLAALLSGPLAGWRSALFAQERNLDAALGKEPDDVFEVMNGGIRCHLFVFGPDARRG